MDPRVVGPVPPRPLAALSQAIAPELRKLEGVSAISFAEIRDMLSFEYQRQMLGCASNEQCLAEIGGALGVDEVFATELTLSGTAYVLTSRRVDMKKARIVGGDLRRFDQRDGEELLLALGPAIGAVYAERPLRAGATRGVSREVIARLNPPPLPTWVFYGTAASAAAVLTGGVVAVFAARGAADDYRTLAARSTTQVVPAAELQRQADRVRSLERTRNGLLAGGGVLAAAAAVEVFFTDWRNDRAALKVTPAAAPGAAGVRVSARF